MMYFCLRIQISVALVVNTKGFVLLLLFTSFFALRLAWTIELLLPASTRLPDLLSLKSSLFCGSWVVLDPTTSRDRSATKCVQGGHRKEIHHTSKIYTAILIGSL